MGESRTRQYVYVVDHEQYSGVSVYLEGGAGQSMGAEGTAAMIM